MKLNNIFKTQTFVFLLLAAILPCSLQNACAVTSKITSHSSSDDFQKGQAENIIIGSKGTLQLSRTSEKVTEEFKDTWAVNSIISSAGKIYIGTSPNGGIYQYSLGRLATIYSAQPQDTEPNDVNDANDKTTAKSEHLANEHIFAMATDISDRLLAAISGRRCALCRLESSELITVYEPNDAKYVFAVLVATDGTIYLGTGPEGKIYSLDSAGENPKLVYDSTDKNILSLALAKDGSLLAGSDTRGLVYKIDPASGKAKVLYDSEQAEITALLVDDNGDIYAAATSANVVSEQDKFASKIPPSGRPEEKSENSKDGQSGGSSLNLKIANTKEDSKSKNPKATPQKGRPAKPEQLSHIYKISPDGFVTDVFTEPAVLFALNQQQDELLLGTGNEAELYTINPTKEQSAVIYKDEKASQITALAVCGDEIYLGTSNPPKLIKLNKSFANEGTFTSDLIDASQPADWGKLQIDAEIPKDCSVTVSARSGNVKDVNDPTFSDWTEPVEIKTPVQLTCPVGRFCQYKLILKTTDGQTTPLIREVAVANTIPNLAPNIKEVSVERIEKPEKQGTFEIKYQALDDNSDTLIYTIDFRKINRDTWIELAEKIDKPSYEWDSRTVEDGRYEIRVTASDEKSNSAHTKLTGARVSDPVVADNTGPLIDILSIAGEEYSALAEPIRISGKQTVIKLSVIDKYSVVSNLDYTIDSNEDYKAAVPDDLVFDTTKENFKIKLDDLKAGRHIIALRAKDDVGNTTYRSTEIEVSEK
ncbi:MAG: hypothetical protein JW804_01945 [Sedimentisphaerales bacterium]|nr:hypothetical protein [Sedimentisphaerales bacterium]